ncbi:GNAT family N-acetyltransferase [Gammaproteobacteria bacterium]|nr:GNAT family N-acetyltransferase [Gammaproteobacteria bacterium]
MKEFTHRIARYEDIPTIELLMELSINQLLGPLLSAEQLEASFDSMGLDNQLIKDGTYFMVFCDDIFVGCGGWSNRETLFGGNHTPSRDDNFLDPLKDSARIRAMYTHPDWARQGIGSLVMHLSENAAKKLGFNKCELMATQSGKLLYETQGYEPIEDMLYKTETGKTVPMIRMEKII